MDGAQLVVSLVSGGLAGGGVSALSNRIFHWRALRTKFEPILNNFFAAYVIRMEDPAKRYWEGEVGYVPKSDDEEFVDLRSGFIAELIQFNELKEARDLRFSLIRNPSVEDGGKMGDHYKVDLMPEYEAVSRCLDIVHKKLKLG